MPPVATPEPPTPTPDPVAPSAEPLTAATVEASPADAACDTRDDQRRPMVASIDATIDAEALRRTLDAAADCDGVGTDGDPMILSLIRHAGTSLRANAIRDQLAAEARAERRAERQAERRAKERAERKAAAKRAAEQRAAAKRAAERKAAAKRAAERKAAAKRAAQRKAEQARKRARSGSGSWRNAPIVTWYGPGFYGNRTACGLRYTRTIVGVAHRTLPCGTLVQFKWRGITATVPVIDRGPYASKAYVFDFSAATSCKVFKPKGVKNACFTRHDVKYRVVGRMSLKGYE